VQIIVPLFRKFKEHGHTIQTKKVVDEPVVANAIFAQSVCGDHIPYYISLSWAIIYRFLDPLSPVIVSDAGVVV
jgi:hypothetical protein